MSESVPSRPAGLLLAGLRVACQSVLGGLGSRLIRWRVWASSEVLVGWSSLGVPASFQAGKLIPGPPCQAARDTGMSSTAGHRESLPGPVVNSGNSCYTGS